MWPDHVGKEHRLHYCNVPAIIDILVRHLNRAYMNICMVIISDGWGGAETVVYELCQELRTLGHRVVIFANRETIHNYSNLRGVTVVDIGRWSPFNPSVLSRVNLVASSGILRSAVYLACSYLNEAFRLVRIMSIRRKIGRLIHEMEIQVVHSHMADADVLSSIARPVGARIVTTIHGEHTLRSAKMPHPLSRPLHSFKARRFINSLNRMDEVIAVSSAELGAIVGWAGIDTRKAVVIHNGIALSELRDINSPICDSSTDFRLLFPGGPKPSKGGDLLIPAICKCVKYDSRIHLYIALDVPPDHELRKMVSKLGLESKVSFVGVLSRAKFRQLMASVDVLVMPSRFEGFPVTILEAMALGKPIIATRVGGIPEVLVHMRNGVLVESDSESIAAAIDYLRNNRDVLRRIGITNSRDIEKLDWHSVARQYLSVYDNLIRR